MKEIKNILIDNDVKGFNVYHIFNNQKAVKYIDEINDSEKLSGFAEGFWKWVPPSIGDYVVATKGVRVNSKSRRQVYAVFKVVGESVCIKDTKSTKALTYLTKARENGRDDRMEPNDVIASKDRHWTPLELIVAINPTGTHFPGAKTNDPFYGVASKLVGEIFSSKSANPCGKFNLK